MNRAERRRAERAMRRDEVIEARRTAGIEQARAALEDLDVPWYWWFLSFVDDTAEPHRFLGACYVDAPETAVGACVGRAWELGCNPGGQVQIAGPLTDEEMDENVPPSLRRRLLTTRADLLAIDVPVEWLDERPHIT